MSPSPNYVIAAVFMVSVINITNFIDGLDGLAGGIVVIASAALYCGLIPLAIPRFPGF